RRIQTNRISGRHLFKTEPVPQDGAGVRPIVSPSKIPLLCTFSGWNTDFRYGTNGDCACPCCGTDRAQRDTETRWISQSPRQRPHVHCTPTMLEQDQNLTLVRGASRVTMNGLGAADTLRQTEDPAVQPFPLNPRTSLGNQLEQVAKLISLRNSLGHEPANLFLLAWRL